MKRVKLLALSVAGVTAFACTTLAFAEFCIPSGWYVEGNIGSSKSSGKDYGLGITTSSSTGLAWNFNGGFKFLQFFALEGGVTSYADTTLNAGGASFATDRHWAYDIAAKGILPVSDTGLQVFGKLGAARIYSSTKLQHFATTTPVGYTVSKNNSTSAYFGAGFDYMVMPTLGLNLQWAQAKGNSKTGIQNLYSIGLTWTLY